MADAVNALIKSASGGEALSPEAKATLAAYPDTVREIAEREAAVLDKAPASLRQQAAEAHEASVIRESSSCSRPMNRTTAT